jgi:hypothetical protein
MQIIAMHGWDDWVLLLGIRWRGGGRFVPAVQVLLCRIWPSDAARRC